MKNMLNKFELDKLPVVVLAALAYVSIWGCSEDRVRWNEGFTGAEIVGFVDDSLVMVGSFQLRTEAHEGTFEPYWDVVESGHERLCVYNYRVQEDGPRWCDTLGEYNMTNAFRGQMTDSIVWGGDMPNSIRLWKVGETQHQIKLKKNAKECFGEFGITSIKQWLDGTFIALGGNLSADGDSCQYAVLDTVMETLTYKRLDKNLEWIKPCDDVRAWGDDVYCLSLDRESFNALLLINSELKNTLLKEDFQLNRYATVSFIGNYMNIFQSLCFLEKEQIKWLTNFSSEKVFFGDGKGNYITYEN